MTRTVALIAAPSFVALVGFVCAYAAGMFERDP